MYCNTWATFSNIWRQVKCNVAVSQFLLLSQCTLQIHLLSSYWQPNPQISILTGKWTDIMSRLSAWGNSRIVWRYIRPVTHLQRCNSSLKVCTPLTWRIRWAVQAESFGRKFNKCLNPGNIWFCQKKQKNFHVPLKSSIFSWSTLGSTLVPGVQA